MDDFAALDIRVGTVASARLLKGSRKPSFALTIDFGELGAMGSAVQIADLYDAEELVGLQVVAVVNVPTKEVAGFASEALVLVVGDGKGDSVLLIPERPVPDGGRVA